MPGEMGREGERGREDGHPEGTCTTNIIRETKVRERFCKKSNVLYDVLRKGKVPTKFS